MAIIEDHTEIGDDSVIYGGTYIGHRCKVGTDCKIYPHVTIREEITIR